ncbi:MAG: flagellar biosynthesis anti-sigma factor FlgM [Proteobacteria bacterium]|nr:flagellar biosynthesis anti-sigma factor FlgM [Pseudomonadota bacterium]MBU1612410.1 flagellar biosynthesis anti-sigma factor FlgM [Pseudomonadota bacterium]
MDIKNVGNLNPYTNRKVAEGVKPQVAGRTDAHQSSSNGDTVSLSSEAKLRGTALAEAGQAPDVRQEKVKELKERVKNGTYKPDLKKAATNLLRDDMQLMNRT